MRSRPVRAGIVATAVVLGAFACFSGVRMLLRPGADGPITNPTDFRAFYCAAKVAGRGANPYLTEPLRTCEDAALKSAGLEGVKGLAIPAPLPPYAFAALPPVAHRPYMVACGLWLLRLVASVAATVIVLHKLTGLPLLALAAVLFPVDGYASFVLGQIVPVVVLVLCSSALLLRRNRIVPGVVMAAMSLVEPHMGLPVCLALFVFEPLAIVPLLGAVIGLASLAYLAVGQSTIVSYFFAVLPAHMHSEVDNFGAQYSLTAAMHALGFPDAIALAAGGMSYFVALGVGCVLAGKLAERFNDRAYLVLAPPVVALIGGTFIHIHQIAFALPLALLLFLRFESPLPKIAMAALLLCLAVPWESIAEMPQVARFVPRPAVVAQVSRGHVNDARLLAETSWEAWIKSAGTRDFRTPEELWLLKFPTWLALVLLMGYAFAAVTPDRRAEA